MKDIAKNPNDGSDRGRDRGHADEEETEILLLL